MSSRRNEGDNWLEGYVPYQIYRITNTLNQRLRARLRSLPISVSRWRVLGVLRARGTLTINEIAEYAAMEQPTVSRTVKRLVTDGLVSRRAARQDSRFMQIKLTANGQHAFEAIYPIAEEHQAMALNGFSKADLKALQGYLHRIQQNIEADIELRAAGN